MTKEERFKQLMESGKFEFLKDIPKDKVWELFFAASYVMNDPEEQEPCEKSINKAFEFGNHKGVGTYWNQQTDTVELPKAVFEYILRQVPTEEQELCDTSDSENPNKSEIPTSCDDTISREAVEKIINKYIDGSFEWGAMLVEIKKLPSIKIKSIECDTVSREAVLRVIDGWYEQNRDTENIEDLIILITYMQSVQPSRKGHWIPLTSRPMTEEEREHYSEQLDYCDGDAVVYDCQLPEEGQEVLITAYGGDVLVDTFFKDYDGCGFEGYDIEDVKAWMPLPEPYKDMRGDTDDSN